MLLPPLLPLAAATIGNSPLTQAPLPFAMTDFDPVISAQTFEFHYGKHHKGYFVTLAKLIAGTPLAALTLEAIILETVGDRDNRSIFNNAAQCWNHNFYWNSLSPAPQTPSGALATAIARDFGSVADLQAALAKVSIAHFGTGWGWLVCDSAGLHVISTDDADVPFTKGQVPLLTVDVWEHAYYLDWQNRRADHVEAIVANHLNWTFAEKCFAASGFGADHN